MVYFSASSERRSSVKFSSSSTLEYSSRFSTSLYYSRSAHVSVSSVFSTSEHHFSGSSIFSGSEGIFSYSKIYSRTEQPFSKSKIFSGSATSKIFSGSEFASSPSFPRSIPFTFSGIFTKSSTFTPSPSSIFSKSAIFSEVIDENATTLPPTLTFTPTPSPKATAAPPIYNVSKQTIIVLPGRETNYRGFHVSENNISKVWITNQEYLNYVPRFLNRTLPLDIYWYDQANVSDYYINIDSFPSDLTFFSRSEYPVLINGSRRISSLLIYGNYRIISPLLQTLIVNVGNSSQVIAPSENEPRLDTAYLNYVTFFDNRTYFNELDLSFINISHVALFGNITGLTFQHLGWTFDYQYLGVAYRQHISAANLGSSQVDIVIPYYGPLVINVDLELEGISLKRLSLVGLNISFIMPWGIPGSESLFENISEHQDALGRKGFSLFETPASVPSIGLRFGETFLANAENLSFEGSSFVVSTDGLGDFHETDGIVAFTDEDGKPASLKDIVGLQFTPPPNPFGNLVVGPIADPIYPEGAETGGGNVPFPNGYTATDDDSGGGLPGYVIAIIVIVVVAILVVAVFFFIKFKGTPSKKPDETSSPFIDFKYDSDSESMKLEMV